jgi:hypothetical protein
MQKQLQKLNVAGLDYDSWNYTHIFTLQVYQRKDIDRENAFVILPTSNVIRNGNWPWIKEPELRIIFWEVYGLLGLPFWHP